MEVRSSRRVRTLVTHLAHRGLSANEIAGALISMMARSTTLQFKVGYIDARPSPKARRNLLATHGRTIHSGQNQTDKIRGDIRNVAEFQASGGYQTV
jgi:hypothetical protein